MVYSVEGNHKWFLQLQENAKQMDGKCDPMECFISSVEDLNNIFKIVGPCDILHSDIEGAEKLFFELDDDFWNSFPIWNLEVHYDYELLKNFVERFLKLNYEVKVFTLDPLHKAWILYAEKMSGEGQCTFEKGYRI